MKKTKKTYKLHEAILHKDIDMVLSCISNGADVNEKDDNSYAPLHYAAQNNLFEIAKILLDAGAEVDPKDSHGNTPLSEAVFNFRDDSSMITLLLNHGANKFEENNYGISPYSLAESIATTSVFTLLR